MQIRSAYQHAWATAVETVGTFTKQALKSSLGEEAWLRFFALMGSVIARKEGATPVPGTPMDERELLGELRDFAGSLDVVNLLTTYRLALSTLGQPSGPSAKDAHFFLLQLDPTARQIRVTGFPLNRSQEAQDSYLAAERAIPQDSSSQAVLVSVDSMSQLRQAYPNYFLDTRLFTGLVEEALSP